MERAGYMLSGSDSDGGTQNEKFWESNNFKVLRCFLYVAAAVHRTMAAAYVAAATVPHSAARTAPPTAEGHRSAGPRSRSRGGCPNRPVRFEVPPR